MNNIVRKSFGGLFIHPSGSSCQALRVEWCAKSAVSLIQILWSERWSIADHVITVICGIPPSELCSEGRKCHLLVYPREGERCIPESDALTTARASFLGLGVLGALQSAQENLAGWRGQAEVALTQETRGRVNGTVCGIWLWDLTIRLEFGMVPCQTQTVLQRVRSAMRGPAGRVLGLLSRKVQ